MDNQTLTNQSSDTVQPDSQPIQADFINAKPIDPKSPAMMRRIMTSEFQGPLPPPAYLAKYNEIHPGLADRIVKLAEGEAEHRRKMETTVLAAQIADSRATDNEARCGQICALIITIASLIAGSYTAMHGHEIAGSILGVGGIGGIVTTFVLGRNHSTSEGQLPETAKADTKKKKKRK